MTIEKTSKKVLVVEDERPLSKAIEDKLSNEGYHTIVASSVEDAIEILKNEEIDIVWLDHYLLGDKIGLDVLVFMKSQEGLKKVPVYVVSNTATEEKVREYEKMGIRKYFVKANSKLDDIVTDINFVTA